MFNGKRIDKLVKKVAEIDLQTKILKNQMSEWKTKTEILKQIIEKLPLIEKYQKTLDIFLKNNEN